MAKLAYQAQVTITDNSGVSSQILSDVEFSSQNEIFRMELNVGPGLSVVAWDPTVWTGFGVTAFQALVLKAEGGNLDCEETVNEGDPNEELNSYELYDGLTTVFATDRAFSNHSASDAFGGTVSVRNKIRVINQSATATVKLVIAIVDNT